VNLLFKLLRPCALLLWTIALPLAGWAQTYPDRPLRIIVPFPGGSNVDQVTRIIGNAMAKELGQPVIVEPMPGAGTVVAVQYAIRQPADGYTMVIVTNSATIKSAVAKPVFDIRRDLAFVGQIASSPMVVAVHKDVPARTLKELVDYAHAHPDKLNLSSYGAGTLGHLSGERFMQLTGARMVHVPYTGSTANALALAQGTSQVTLEVVNSVRPFQQKGLVRYLAVCAPARIAELPDVPTAAESGVANFNAATWSGLAVPAGTPPPIIDKLNKALAVALKDPAMLAFSQTSGLGTLSEPTSPKAFTALVTDNVDVFRNLIREARLDVE
jgi:tripartite-type tricarboxylate transporter receptor subunit TctC